MHDIQTDPKNEPEIDPIYGIEEARKKIFKLSKAAFYSPDSILHDLPVIQLSAKRKGIRLSDIRRVLEARTTPPRNASS
jgi:DNA-binding transcriptional MerR regulator